MVLTEFKNIRAIVLDVDGVLTDGTVQVTEQGEQLRTFSIKDGYALQLAVKQGLSVFVISGGNANSVRLRLAGLGIQEIHLGVTDKLSLMTGLLADRGISLAETLYMGDDIPDLACMEAVGLPVCPNDAVEEVKQVAKYMSPKNGGAGCVRDVLEKILKLKQLWTLSSSIKSQ